MSKRWSGPGMVGHAHAVVSVADPGRPRWKRPAGPPIPNEDPTENPWPDAAAHGGAAKGRSDDTQVWGKRGSNPPPRGSGRANPGIVSRRATQIIARM